MAKFFTIRVERTVTQYADIPVRAPNKGIAISHALGEAVSSCPQTPLNWVNDEDSFSPPYLAKPKKS